jgi:transcriptional regulator with XRE-family HTH domain
LIKQQMLDSMKASRDYRRGFIEEAIRSRLTAQINALRDERGWDLKTFAGKLGKKLSWAYRLEDPNESVPTIPTLLEVAETFDIGLDVRFRRFSELLDDATTLKPESFLVPSFDSELKNMAFGRQARKIKLRGLRTNKYHKIAQKRGRRVQEQFNFDFSQTSATSDGRNFDYARGEHGAGEISQAA